MNKWGNHSVFDRLNWTQFKLWSYYQQVKENQIYVVMLCSISYFLYWHAVTFVVCPCRRVNSGLHEMLRICDSWPSTVYIIHLQIDTENKKDSVCIPTVVNSHQFIKTNPQKPRPRTRSARHDFLKRKASLCCCTSDDDDQRWWYAGDREHPQGRRISLD
jgi:hypothetical protein